MRRGSYNYRRPALAAAFMLVMGLDSPAFSQTLTERVLGTIELKGWLRLSVPLFCWVRARSIMLSGGLVRVVGCSLTVFVDLWRTGVRCPKAVHPAPTR